jgi:hypothetical protein
MNRIMTAGVIACLLMACNDNDHADVKPSADSAVNNSAGDMQQGSTTDTGAIIQKDSGYRVARPTPADTGVHK